MAKNLFSIPIFFIVFRETLEAAIIVSVLLGLAKQLVEKNTSRSPSPIEDDDTKENSSDGADTVDDVVARRRLLRKLRFQIFLGAGLGFLLALAIGAGFIAVWFKKASNLWEKSEALWEGIFRLVASLMIFVTGVTMLRMDRAKVKWRVKFQRAFEGKDVEGRIRTGKWVLFLLPFLTVLREGMEAVVFVGGVSLGQPGSSIPIATIVGLVCGLIIGFIIYQFASRSTLTIFLVVMTNLLLLIGAGLFSRAVGAFEENHFNKLLGADLDDAGGNGPGSYLVQGNVWHLDCCNPESKFEGQGWGIFSALFGWTNNGTVGTVLAYVFYWIAVIVTLVLMKFFEGRTKIAGRQSSRGAQREKRREEEKQKKAVSGDGGADLPQ